jgi:two-component sensor histidine kinase/HAMP domain-containing protein
MIKNKLFFKLWSPFKLRTKIILFFALFFIVLMALIETVTVYGVPFTRFEGERRKIEAETFRKLNLVADLKKERLLRWIEERSDNVDVLVESPIIIDSVQQVREVIHNHAAQGKNEEELRLAIRNEEAQSGLSAHLKLLKSMYGGYKDIEIVDKDYGVVLASTDSAEPGMNGTEREAFTSITGPYDYYFGLERPDLEQENGYYLVIARSINIPDSGNGVEEMAIAVLLAYIDPYDFLKPLLHTGGGLGKTGEVVLINKERKIIAPLKHRLLDGTSAIPLEHEIRADPAVFAARGEEGIVVSTDYRGVDVLAAFRHHCFTPEARWGMVVKSDLKEVFAMPREIRRYTIVIGVAGTLAGVLLIGVVATRVTRPISRMTDVAQRIQNNDFSMRVQTSSADELGFLAQTFNTMIDHVANWKVELEKQVNERTDELSQEIVQRKEAEEKIKASLQEKVVLLREIYHRVKNNMQVIASLMRLQSRRISDELARDALLNTQERIMAMSLVHETLYQSKSLSMLGFQSYARRLVKNLKEAHHVEKRHVEISVDAGEDEFAADEMIPLGLIITELVSNALKYAFDKDGRIEIKLNKSGDDNYEMVISDNGRGLPDNIDFNTTETMGLQLVRDMAEGQLRGSVSVTREKGTRFNIRFRKGAQERGE